MSNAKKIIGGILLVLAALSLLVYTFFPELAILQLPLWKWIVGLILVYWTLRNLLFGRSLRKHFDIFLPLALLFMLLERHIAPLIGKSADFVNNWGLLLSAILLTVAVYLLLPGKKFRADNVNRFSSKIIYLDASERGVQSVANSFGETEVYLKNTDIPGQDHRVRIVVRNRFGQTIIHVPAEWTVTGSPSNSFGEVSIRADIVDGGRELSVSGSNSFGEFEIVSP